MTQSNIQTLKNQQTNNPSAWYKPTFSPEHGVYVVLFGSFITGAAAAQNWNWNTTLALIFAFCGFQAEFPLGNQLKQRRNLKPRFLLWGGLYGAIALAIGIWLYLQTPVLLWVYAIASAAFGFDLIEIWRKERKSIINELVTFAAVCLSAPLAYLTIKESFTSLIVGLWLLNTLYFSSSIFTVKLRKPKTSSLTPAVVYHFTAIMICLALYWFNWLGLVTVLAFAIVLVKFALIIWQLEWYRTTPIQYVAMIETISALMFVVITSLSLLPLHLISV